MKTIVALVGANIVLVAIGAFCAGYNYRSSQERGSARVLAAAIAETYGASNATFADDVLELKGKGISEAELRRSVRSLLDK